MQYFNDGNQQCQCFVSNDLTKSTSLGKSNGTSITGKDGKTYGSNFVNAIYQVTSTAPYVGCYNDSATSPAMTAVNNGVNTYTMASCQQYAEDNGFSLFGLQGVNSSSSSGDIKAQCMVSNSSRSTQQYGMAQPCTKGNDGYKYGSPGVNALYEVTSGGSLSDVGKMGYVDQNGILSDYPASAESLSTTYTTIPKYDNQGGDIQGSSYGNASDAKCQTTCNNMSNCYGYVFDTATSTCYPKNSGIYPNSQKQPNPNRNLNIRNKVLTSGTAATNRGVSNVDSNAWSNYVNNGNTVPDNKLNIGNFFGFSDSNNPFKESFTTTSPPSSATNNVDPVQQNVLSQLEDRLNLLTQQINSNTNQYKTNNQNVSQESDLLSNNVQEYIDEYNEIKNKLKNYSKSGDKNVAMILKESDLVMTNKNYTYLLYAILLIGSAIVALKIINSK